MDELLSREEFKKVVFASTNGICCVPGCCERAVDAHHIMDRKLWSDGGYYRTNGAALCSRHHLEAEDGTITPKDCLDYMGISINEIRIPDSLHYSSEEYCDLVSRKKIDKWGKEVVDVGYDPNWFKKFKK